MAGKTWQTRLLETVPVLALSGLGVWLSTSGNTVPLFLFVFIILYISVRNRLILFTAVPIVYIALFHPGVLLDIYVLLSCGGSLLQKLVSVKICFVHTTPPSYWLKISGELTAVLVCLYSYSCCLRYAENNHALKK